MGRFKGEGRITTSVTISPTFFNLCKQHNIIFSEALRVGISLILAERGIADYDNSLNLSRQLKITEQKFAEINDELLKLKEKYESSN